MNISQKERNAMARLVWRYGYSCLEIRYGTDDISTDDYMVSQSYIQDEVQPPAEFVEKVLPGPYKRAKTLQEMQRYWREEHTYENGEKTPVVRGEVYLKHYDEFGREWHKVQIFCSGILATVSVQNVHRLDVGSREIVRVHNYNIAELESEF